MPLFKYASYNIALKRKAIWIRLTYHAMVFVLLVLTASEALLIMCRLWKSQFGEMERSTSKNMPVESL